MRAVGANYLCYFAVHYLRRQDTADVSPDLLMAGSGQRKTSLRGYFNSFCTRCTLDQCSDLALYKWHRQVSGLFLGWSIVFPHRVSTQSVGLFY